jgi:hypothetical protein
MLGLVINIDATPTHTHPTNDLAGISNKQSKVWDILQNDRASADKGVLADGHATDDCAVGPKRRTQPDQRRTELVHPPDLAARVEHIGEDHGWTAKDMILKGHSFIHRDVVLYFDPIADVHVWTDHHVLADPTILSNPGVFQDVGEMPDRGPFANLNAIVNTCGLMRGVWSRTL